MLVCGYCDGKVTENPPGVLPHYVHADDGDRVAQGGPGDFVSHRHNLAGTPVNPVDLIDEEEEDTV